MRKFDINVLSDEVCQVEWAKINQFSVLDVEKIIKTGQP